MKASFAARRPQILPHRFSALPTTMRKSLTLLIAALFFGLLASSVEARTQRPANSARFSDLWSANRGRVRVDATLRPTAGLTNERSSSSSRSRRLDRFAERRAAITSRYDNPGQTLSFYYPGTVSPSMGSRGVQSTQPLTTMQPVKVRPPQLEPLPREHERWLSLRVPVVPPQTQPLAVPRPGREPSADVAFFAQNTVGASSVAPHEPAREPVREAFVPPPSPPATKSVKKESAPKTPPAPAAKHGANAGGTPPNKGAGEFDHLPFGVPVPGKSGYVTLSGKYSGLPEIDVRGIAPGTPVEIPDPGAPGATIQFRVP